MLTALALAFQIEAKLTGTHLVGDLRSIAPFHSKILNNDRTLRIYLPPNYEKNKRERYPVIYMQDGQNLFDPKLSAFSHNEWRADETAEALIATNLIQPIIIVGIDNTAARADEYLPTRAKMGNQFAGGKAEDYLKFLLNEVKPYIDSHYRTKKDRINTAIGGSSFGGIISLYAGLAHPESFSKVLALSPSIWWDSREMLIRIKNLKAKPQIKIWIDIGSREAGDNEAINRIAQTDAGDAEKALETKGWTLGKDLYFFTDYDAEHTESAWARRFGMILLTLFPRR